MIPFNRASFGSEEVAYLAEAIDNGHTAGNGPLGCRAEQALESMHGGGRALLTSSCTHALEMAARLLNLQPGDEVIVPAFTFVSTASAFMSNGARLVFADVRSDTLNIDPKSVESLITDRTRALCVVHYGGVGADLARFVELANRHGLMLIEDNAHGLGGRYQDQVLGTFGSLSTLSFHETKTITCGEGGALIVNDPALVERAEILREKGTNRSQFVRGQVDKYTWVDVGSSWLLSDLLAGVLLAQLERFDHIAAQRLARWNTYLEALTPWAAEQGVMTPVVPSEAAHTAHLFHLRLPNQQERDRFIEHLRQREVLAVFHYQPLNTSSVARSLGPQPPCPNAEHAATTLVRLPLFAAMTDAEHDQVIDSVRAFAVRYER